MPTTIQAGETDSLGLQKISESGKAPRRRLTSAMDAYSTVEKLVRANDARRTMYSEVQGMFDGNAPWSASKLRAAGMSWCSNFNTMEAKSLRSQAGTPFYDLFNSTKFPIDVQTAFGAIDQIEDRSAYSRIISEGLRRLIRRYQPWHSNFWGMICDMIAFNKGFIMWQGPDTHAFRWVPQHLVEVPDDTSCDLDELDILQVRRYITVSALWTMAHGKHGWNQKLLYESARQASCSKGEPWDDIEVQRRMNENDMDVSSGAAKVELVELFVREFGSEPRYSHYAIDRNMLTKEPETRSRDFLFEMHSIYDAPEQFIIPYFFEVGNGGWNACAGLGKDIHALMKVNDRLACKQVDGAFQRLSIILQAMTAESVNKAALVNVGSVTVIPPGFNVQQSSLLGDITTAIAVRQDLKNIVAGNTGVFRPSIEKSAGNPPTATEMNLRYQQSTTLTSSAVDRFYDQHDVFCREFYRRVMRTVKDGSGRCKREAKDFVEYCRVRGVPREALDKTDSISAMRSVGSGSTFLRQQSYMAVGQSFLPMMPEDGRLNYLEDTTAVMTDQALADRWFPQSAKRRMPSDDEAFATLENAAIRIGSPAIRTPRQNDVVHAQVHLLAGTQAVESMAQGADPATVLQFLSGIGSHVFTHLEPMEQDPTRKQVYTTLKDQWEGLAKVADGLKDELTREAQAQQESAQQQQQAQAVQQGNDPDIQLQAAVQQKKLELSEEKMRHQMGLRQKQSEQKMALADASTAADIRRKSTEQKVVN
jgi:hypothetical protein